MTRTPLIIGGIMLLGLALTACSSGGGGGTAVVVPGPTPPAPTPAFSAQFGSNFSTAFESTATGEPRPIASGDVIAANPGAEPVALR